MYTKGNLTARCWYSKGLFNENVQLQQSTRYRMVDLRKNGLNRRRKIVNRKAFLETGNTSIFMAFAYKIGVFPIHTENPKLAKKISNPLFIIPSFEKSHTVFMENMRPNIFPGNFRV